MASWLSSVLTGRSSDQPLPTPEELMAQFDKERAEQKAAWLAQMAARKAVR